MRKEFYDVVMYIKSYKTKRDTLLLNQFDAKSCHRHKKSCETKASVLLIDCNTTLYLLIKGGKSRKM